MRQLHVLGVSDDGAALLLGTKGDAGKPSHRVPLDDRLRAAVRGQIPSRGSDRAESALTPKEIQARLRGGATPEDVAKVAQVPVARVLPYFAPVEAERERIVEQARRGHLRRARGPQAEVALGEAVDARLREVAGLKADSVVWTARRREDASWVVAVSYAARGGRRSAEWLWRPTEREVSPLDNAASRLGADPAPAARARGGKARPSRPAAARTSSSAAPPRARQAKRAVTATRKPAAAARSTAAPAPKSTRTTTRAPRKDAARTPSVTARPAPSPAPSPAPRLAPPPRQTRRRTAKPAAPPVVEQVAAAPEPAESAAAAARRPGTRVPLPSWSDVLLGVQAPDIAARSEPAPHRRGDATRRRRS